MNTELIEQEFDESDVSSRPGSYGKLLTYIAYPAYVRRMNQVFDYQWSCEVTDLRFTDDEVIAVVKVTAGGIVKMQAGGKKLTRTKDGAQVSLGDDTKSAITTAFKKACQMFGIGIYLVGSEEEEFDAEKPHRATTRTDGTISQSQLAFIKELRTAMGMTAEEVQETCFEMFKTRAVTSLNTTQASALIQALKVAKQNRDHPDDSPPF